MVPIVNIVTFTMKWIPLSQRKQLNNVYLWKILCKRLQKASLAYIYIHVCNTSTQTHEDAVQLSEGGVSSTQVTQQSGIKVFLLNNPRVPTLMEIKQNVIPNIRSGMWHKTQTEKISQRDQRSREPCDIINQDDNDFSSQSLCVYTAWSEAWLQRHRRESYRLYMHCTACWVSFFRL